MIPALIIAVIWNLWNAEHDAIRINNNKKVSHEANAGLYLAFIIVVCFLVSWIAAVPLLALRPLLFDSWLNQRRGKPYNYQPETPDSFVDRMENKIFGHKRAWLLSNLFYLVLFIASLYIYFKYFYE
jgi:hypothetical protein